ncbi:MAG: YceH family protein [Thermodesulfobacteriota bacterium]
METVLTAPEIRVLGCLMEKEMATPEYYPLSLNALLNACNQKSNREPVVAYDEETVLRALQTLREKRFILQSDASRVTKYEQTFSKNRNLLRKEAALLCLLMLRGAQTVGELRGRADRLYEFADLADVERTVNNLAEMGLVVRLARQPGRKECRFAQLLGGEIVMEEAETETAEPASLRPGQAERIRVLEEELDSLKKEVADLRQTFTDFRKQFE